MDVARPILLWLGKMFRGLQRIVRGIEPWTILLAAIGLVFTFVTILVESEDRQSERVFRAWEVILSITDANQGRQIGSGSAARQALEYLNREFNGWGCYDFVGDLALEMTGNDKRECLLPRKRRESLVNLSMKGVDLRDVVLRGANLQDATLIDVNFDHAKLSNAIFNGAVIVEGSFFRANLQRARFYSAELKNAFLYCANMSGAQLGAAKMQQVIGGPSRLGIEIWLRDPSCNLGYYALDLTGAILRGAKLSDAYLAFANLTQADFGAAELSGTNLCGANISGARMKLVKGLSQDQLDLACARRDSPPDVSSELQWKGMNSQNGHCAYLEEPPPRTLPIVTCP